MPQFEVVWTESAQNDLIRIIKYIEYDGKEIAKNIYRKIKSKVVSLKDMPLQGRVLPELGQYGIDDYRELIENPWRIIYKTGDHNIYIIAVIDGRRDMEDLLRERTIP
ncbi:MAG: plasmid stabilization protein [Spirochaetes bacterium GWF1_51_8]|nr:MAG: plasmid stabilization protein [Spirochaetes bacterium GWF1_51_8]